MLAANLRASAAPEGRRLHRINERVKDQYAQVDGVRVLRGGLSNSLEG
jgi:hypothetical protein